MAKKYTQEEFIARAIAKHGDGRYDYSKVHYVNNNTKVTIICPEHGEFEQRPAYHLKGGGCRKCYNKRTSERLYYDTEKFIELARKKHGDKYDYSKVQYVDSKTKVTIICPTHGEFQQSPRDHLQGKGCFACAVEYRSKLRIQNTGIFIRRAKDIHGDRYDYSKSVYVNNRQPLIITCPVHGDFLQSPNTHLDNHGCPYCKGDAERERLLNGKAKAIAPDHTKTTEEFIADAIRLHDDKYRYDKVDYVTSKEKVIITCPEHGDFEVTPNDHLSGRGCPKCHQSFGERRVGLFLERHDIKHKPQKKLYYTDEEGTKRYFQVDFYLPNGNVVIEYNGEQHYMPVKSWEGDEGFEKQLKRDAALRKYCKKHGYRLIEIPYTELRHIDEILEQELRP